MQPLKKPTMALKLKYDKRRAMISCPLCGKNDWEPLDAIRPPIEDSHLCICKNDGFMTYNPQLADLSSFYESEMKVQSIEFLMTKAHKLEYHKKLLAPHIKKGMKVLDYGCSDGYLLKYLRDEYDCETKGVEFNPGHANWGRYAEDIDIISHDDISCWNMKFDVIVCYHVLEHVRNPQELLRKFRKNLAKDGILYLAVPIIDKPDYPSMYGEHVPEPPINNDYTEWLNSPKKENCLLKSEHVNVFSKDSLIYFLNMNSFDVQSYDDVIYGCCTVSKKTTETKISTCIEKPGFKIDDYGAYLYDSHMQTLKMQLETFMHKHWIENNPKNIEKCREVGKEAIAKNDSNSDLIIKWASIYDEVDALVLLEKYANKRPDLYRIRQYYAHALFRAERYTEAIAEMQKTIDTVGYQQMSLEVIMKSYFELGDIDNFKKWSKKLLDFYPRHPAYINMISGMQAQL